ncbi:MAG: urease accessory protein UreF [Pseudomonadota bacterium]
MSTEPTLQHLLTWFSPAFPIGGFSYSHGLEAAIENGLVRDWVSLEEWISDVLRYGAGWNDVVLLSQAYRRTDSGEPLDDLVELAIALCPTAELQLETCAQGRAFAETTNRVWSLSSRPAGPDIPYPIAVAQAAAYADMPLALAVEAYLHAFAANLTSAAVRAIPLGQTDGLLALAAQEELIKELAPSALRADLEQIGGFVPMLEWCSMWHETQYTRLFRS